jgi:2-polyprenyl-3-methyl-5-hydroxy-6-metoxy-1,4-benzoquinol methylase
MKEYLKFNRQAWDKKVPVHLESAFYRMGDFLAGSSSLNDIELDLLGNLKDKSILHLQCHFGQDSISLSRLGAAVVGVDFSDKAIEEAGKLADKLKVSTRFICSDVYELPNKLKEKFDIVFTTYGTIGWLPDIDRWAKVVATFLKPGGSLVFAEFHPVVWMFDDSFNEITYAYFKRQEIIETTEGTYAEPSAELSQKTITWNHGLAEVLQSLMDQGLKIDTFREYDYSPYDCFKGMIEFAPGKYRINKMGDKLPMVYALRATRQE